MFDWKITLVIINAVLGLALFELTWHRLRRVRKMDTEFGYINKQFPVYRRIDVNLWARWKFWPGAMTLLIPRFLATFAFFIIAWISVVIILIGVPREEPLKGCRLKTVTVLFKALTRIGLFFIACCWVSLNYKQDVDYSKYLGPDSKKLST
jgi:hypothetical protein